MLNQIKSNQIKSNRIKSNQTNQLNSTQIKSTQIKSNQIKSLFADGEEGCDVGEGSLQCVCGVPVWCGGQLQAQP
jgi:hypothetical protein